MPMDCRFAQFLIHFARPVTELPAEDRDRLAEHVASCAECRQLAEQEMAFDAARSRAMGDVEVPGGLRDRIVSRMGEQKGKAVWRRVYRYSGAAAALAAAIVLAISFPLGWWSKQTTISAPQLITEWEYPQQFVVLHSADRAQSFFSDQGLRTEIPNDFDFAFLRNMEVVTYHGHNVAQLDFANGQFRARIVVLPKKHFKFDAQSGFEFEVRSEEHTSELQSHSFISY